MIKDFSSETYSLVVQDDFENILINITGIYRWEIPYYINNETNCKCTDLQDLCYSNIMIIDNLIFEIPCIADNKTFYIFIEREECIYGKK